MSISLAETLDATHRAKASHLALREAIYPARASGACHRPWEPLLAQELYCQSGDSPSAARGRVDLDQAALAKEGNLARMQFIAPLREHAPFDEMESGTVEFLAHKLALGYYARGELITEPIAALRIGSTS